MRIRAIKIGFMAAVASAALWGGSGIAVAGGGCHSAPTARHGDSVEISDLCFDATVLYVEPGTEVTWTNLDSMTHDVVGVGDTWGDPGLSLLTGDDVSYRFDDGRRVSVRVLAPSRHGGRDRRRRRGRVGPGRRRAWRRPKGIRVPPRSHRPRSSRAAATTPRRSGWSWTALVLGALAGAFVVAMRNRRKAPVAG